MPILMVALVALAVFLTMGVLLMMASAVERRRARQALAATELPAELAAKAPAASEEKPKARAAHA